MSRSSRCCSAIFEQILGECPYKSPTDMGVNMAGNCIFDDEAVSEASRQEIIRRYYTALCGQRQGAVSEETVLKLELLMKKAGVTIHDRKVVSPALQKAALTGAPAAAMELPDGTIVTGRTSDLLGAASALLLNALKVLGGISDDIRLISPVSHRADPAPEGRPSGQPQPAPAHRRGADRPLHLRGHQPDRRACDGAAEQAARLRGPFLGHPLLGG